MNVHALVVMVIGVLCGCEAAPVPETATPTTESPLLQSRLDAIEKLLLSVNEKVGQVRSPEHSTDSTGGANIALYSVHGGRSKGLDAQHIYVAHNPTGRIAVVRYSSPGRMEVIEALGAIDPSGDVRAIRQGD